MSRQRGSLIIFTYLGVTSLVVWGTTAFRRSALELNASERYIDGQQAFHLSEAGLDQVASWMDTLPEPPTGTNSFDPCGDVSPPSAALCQTCPCELTGGTFTATIDPDDDNPTSYLNLYTITVTAQAAGVPVTRQLSQWVQTESFARFAYFTDSEKLLWFGRLYPVWFTSNDHLTGPVHTNDEDGFNISGDPIFDGEVTSAADSINYRSGGPPADNPQFNGGLTLGADAIVAPNAATKLRTAAASAGGLWFEGNTTVVLEPSGTLRVTNAAAGLSDQPMPMPGNGALFVNGGNATVSGTLNGQLTIGASADVIVGDDLCYSEHPSDDPAILASSPCYATTGASNPDSDDVLGLVAERDVIVSVKAADPVTSELEIHGSLMALDSSFTVERWWDPNYLNGTLTVYGGIIQDSRGPVGTFSSSTGLKRSGYSKDYRYDSRLAETAPPFYPTTGQYAVRLWRED